MNGTDLPTIQVDGTLDIETEGWDKLVVGGLHVRGRSFRAFSHRHEDDYLDAILECEGLHLYAHNGGCYDGLYLLDRMLNRAAEGQVNLITAGQRIISIEVEGGPSIHDSMALAPMALEKFAQIGAHRKLSTGLACICGRPGCKGWCRIRRDMLPIDFAQLVEYMRMDCVSLFSALDHLVEWAEQHEVALSRTVGASAWKTVKHNLQIKNANWNNPRGRPEVYYNAARKAYFGGRTQVFRPSLPAGATGYRYDLNSAYPAALAALSLPVGRAVERHERQASRAYNSGTAGIYEVTVDVPRKMHIPPLPVRTPERITYPVGTFHGAWTFNELSYAESIGVKIAKHHMALTWTETEPILRPFCERMWKLRDEAGPKSALGTWIKWLTNSLTGKFAQDPEREEVIIDPDEVTFCEGDHFCPKEGACSERRGCCKHRCWGTCGAMIPLDRRDRVFLRRTYRLPSSGHIHWAAYLTAHTRVELHRMLVADGQGGRTALYCDTDSCYASAPRTYRISEHELGFWKFEGEMQDWSCLAPKTYCYTVGGEEARVLKARSKGIPDAVGNWLTIADGGRVLIDKGVKSFRSALRAGGPLFVRKDLSRAITPDGFHFGDRLLSGDGLTHPQMV